jgi:hypothetical protein
MMPIVNTNTGKIIATDEELIKKAKEWFASMTDEELTKLFEEEMLLLEKAGEGE